MTDKLSRLDIKSKNELNTVEEAFRLRQVFEDDIEIPINISVIPKYQNKLVAIKYLKTMY